MKGWFDLVIFDCDGVLVDSEILAARAHSTALQALGINLDERTIATRYVGCSGEQLIGSLQSDLGVALPESYLSDARSRMAALFEHGLVCTPGLAELLVDLPVPYCVASNSSRARVHSSLDRVGLLSAFDPWIFSAEMVARAKPAPDVFLLAASSMNVQPERCLVVEDSVHGVRAAVSAGMTAYGFVGGSHQTLESEGGLLRAGASWCFGNMMELDARISRSSAAHA